jgi:DNA-binding NtrC family response regulator
MKKSSQKILVVEGNPQILELVIKMINLLDLTVLVASDGNEVRKIFKSQLKDIIFVMIDISIIGINFKKIIHDLRLMKSDIHIILTNVYYNDMYNSYLKHEKNLIFLEKPYSFDKFKKVINTVIKDNVK